MSEAKHQKKIIDQYKKDGWLVLRLRDTPTSISQTGTPDLLVMKALDNGTCAAKFIEVKAKGKTTSKLQDFHIKGLRAMGFDCEINEEG